MMDIEKLIERLNECAQSYTVHDDSDLIDTLKNSAIAFSTLQAENERLRGELEKVKQERDAAIKDIWVPKWISCKNGENCGFVSAVTGMPDCAGCDNWEWRNSQKED